MKTTDHAVLSAVGAERPSMKQAHEKTWRGTGWGALWGVMVTSTGSVSACAACPRACSDTNLTDAEQTLLLEAVGG